MLRLKVQNGKEEGRRFELAGDQAQVIGRQAEGIRLHDSRVSREHCMIECKRGQWFIRDRGSSNGTFVNDKQITDATPLNEGDMLGIGRLRIKVAVIATESEGPSAGGEAEPEAIDPSFEPIAQALSQSGEDDPDVPDEPEEPAPNQPAADIEDLVADALGSEDEASEDEPAPESRRKAVAPDQLPKVDPEHASPASASTTEPDAPDTRPQGSESAEAPSPAPERPAAPTTGVEQPGSRGSGEVNPGEAPSAEAKEPTSPEKKRSGEEAGEDSEEALDFIDQTLAELDAEQAPETEADQPLTVDASEHPQAPQSESQPGPGPAASDPQSHGQAPSSEPAPSGPAGPLGPTPPTEGDAAPADLPSKPPTAEDRRRHNQARRRAETQARQRFEHDATRRAEASARRKMSLAAASPATPATQAEPSKAPATEPDTQPLAPAPTAGPSETGIESENETQNQAPETEAPAQSEYERDEPLEFEQEEDQPALAAPPTSNSPAPADEPAVGLDSDSERFEQTPFEARPDSVSQPAAQPHPEPLPSKQLHDDEDLETTSQRTRGGRLGRAIGLICILGLLGGAGYLLAIGPIANNTSLFDTDRSSAGSIQAREQGPGKSNVQTKQSAQTNTPSSDPGHGSPRPSSEPSSTTSANLALKSRGASNRSAQAAASPDADDNASGDPRDMRSADADQADEPAPGYEAPAKAPNGADADRLDRSDPTKIAKFQAKSTATNERRNIPTQPPDRSTTKRRIESQTNAPATADDASISNQVFGNGPGLAGASVLQGRVESESSTADSNAQAHAQPSRASAQPNRTSPGTSIPDRTEAQPGISSQAASSENHSTRIGDQNANSARSRDQSQTATGAGKASFGSPDSASGKPASTGDTERVSNLSNASILPRLAWASSASETADGGKGANQTDANHADNDPTDQTKAEDQDIPGPIKALPKAERVAFLLDGSGSMVDTMPAMIDWLTKAMTKLSPDQQFTVIFFRKNQAIEPLDSGLHPATDQTKARVKNWLKPSQRNVHAQGESGIAQAMEHALSYDVKTVYLLADDDFASNNPDVRYKPIVGQLNRALRNTNITLHTVQFLYRDNSEILRSLAQSHNGAHQFVRPAPPNPIENTELLTGP